MNDIVIGRSNSDKEKYGNKGAVFLGKHYVKMGRTNSLSNPVYMDVTNSHVVFVCGKRGGGKCLVGETELTMGDGSLKKIKDLERDDKPVMSLNKDLKITKEEKEDFFVRTVKSTLKITLETGKTIRCTKDHPLLSFYGWEEAQDLTIGMRIATPKIIPTFGEYDVEEEKVKTTAYSLTEKNIRGDSKLYNEAKKLELTNLNKIPAYVFKLPKHKLSLFLNRYLSANADLKKEKHWMLKGKTKVAKQLQHLLLRFGVISKIKKNNITITENFLRTYLNEIGLYGLQEEKQKRALRETPVTRIEPIDIPEELAEFFDPEDWEVLGEKFIKNIENQYTYKENGVTKTQQSLFIEALQKSDIYWDEVTKIERIEKSVKVYDITVPETNNFVANDIIVHNSYTMGVVAEGVADLPKEIRENLSIVLIDTMGVYWTMKYPNKQDPKLLKEWGLEAKSLDIKIFTPKGYFKKYKDEGVPTDYPFAIKPSELSGNDWNLTFSIKPDDPIGVLIEKTIHNFNEEEIDYDIEEVIKKIDAEKDFEKHVRTATKNLFLNAQSWGIFDKNATKISELVKPGQVSVLDVSCYATMPGSWSIKNLVTGIVSERLFVQRMTARKEEEYKEVHKSANPFGDNLEKRKEPLVWLVIDEAHEFLPNEGKTLATDPLVTILREGRQPGISLILASQQPGKIHTDVMTQADTVIAHRITAKIDTDALGTLMQSYMRKGLVEELDNLPREKGAAILFDDTNEKMYPVRIRPRFTWHGGDSPKAIEDSEEE